MKTPSIESNSSGQLGADSIFLRHAAHERQKAEQHYQSLINRRLAGEEIDMGSLNDAQQALSRATTEYNKVIRTRLEEQAKLRSRPVRLDTLNPDDNPSDIFKKYVYQGYQERGEDQLEEYEAVFYGHLHRDEQGLPGLPVEIAVFMPKNFNLGHYPEQDDYRIMTNGEQGLLVTPPRNDIKIERSSDSNGIESVKDSIVFWTPDGPNFYQLKFNPLLRNGTLSYYVKSWEGGAPHYEEKDVAWLIMDDEFRAKIIGTQVGSIAVSQ